MLPQFSYDTSQSRTKSHLSKIGCDEKQVNHCRMRRGKSYLQITLIENLEER